MAAFAAGQHQRIGRVEQHRARVAAGHGAPGVAIGALAGRVRGAKTGFGLFQRGGDVEIAAGGPGGGRRMGGGHGEPRVVPSITAFWRRIRTHGKPLIAPPPFRTDDPPGNRNFMSRTPTLVAPAGLLDGRRWQQAAAAVAAHAKPLGRRTGSPPAPPATGPGTRAGRAVGPGIAGARRGLRPVPGGARAAQALPHRRHGLDHGPGRDSGRIGGGGRCPGRHRAEPYQGPHRRPHRARHGGRAGLCRPLRVRVAALAGLEEAAPARTPARIRPMPGAAALVATMRAHGATCRPVGGGFTQFTDAVAARLRAFPGQPIGNRRRASHRCRGRADPRLRRQAAGARRYKRRRSDHRPGSPARACGPTPRRRWATGRTTRT